MRKVDFDLSASASAYSVLIGERMDGFSEALISEVRGKKVLVLSDSGAAEASLDSVQTILNSGGVEHSVHIIDRGEKAKGFASLDSVLSALIDGRFTRNDMIINLGGGVIGDLGGFAAAVFMRGIAYVNIPTTLLSMIDSSMGGKTGIDHFGVKNIIGAFHQPKLVICAASFLESLPEREKRSGFGEVLKYYCLSGSKLIKDAILNNLIDPLLIEECCRIKRDCVCDDIRDLGKRRLLNLGHTFGHAFEAASDFSLLHGEAVSMGLVAAMRFGEELGVTDPGVSNRIEQLASIIGLIYDYSDYSESASQLLSHDKKSDSESIEMAFISSFGQPLLRRIPIELASDFLLSSRR